MGRTDIFFEWFSEHFSYITPLCVGCSETFRPTDQNSLVDSCLTEEQVKFNKLRRRDMIYSRAGIRELLLMSWEDLAGRTKMWMYWQWIQEEFFLHSRGTWWEDPLDYYRWRSSNIQRRSQIIFDHRLAFALQWGGILIVWSRIFRLLGLSQDILEGWSHLNINILTWNRGEAQRVWST